jgi:hypothetical protein
MAKVQKIVLDNMEKSYTTSAQRYNLRARPKDYRAGDIVYRKNFKLSNSSKQYSAKLGDRHVKCVITKKVGSNTYQLADYDSKIDVGTSSSINEKTRTSLKDDIWYIFCISRSYFLSKNQIKKDLFSKLDKKILS